MYESATAVHEGQPRGARRFGALALALQDAFTVIVRLRGARQVGADAEAFRAHFKRLLSQADSSSRNAGHAPESVRLAIYAIVAFVDESVLSSANPMFANWASRPLQEEIFGEHMAGEVFFDNLNALLARADTPDLADVLEVYQLCLLLGFQGRYGGRNDGQLAALKTQITDKIVRVRGAGGELSPDGSLPTDEVVKRGRDPWVRRLVVLNGVVIAAATGLWLVYGLILRSGVSGV